jgi:hypothetical protein
MVHTASGWGEPGDPDASPSMAARKCNRTAHSPVRYTEREHIQYPLLRHAGRGADCRTGVGMNCRPQQALRGAAEAHYHPSQPYSSTAAPHGALLHAVSRSGRVPSSAGSPARARGKGRGILRRRGRVALRQGRPGSRRGRGTLRGHVLFECNESARCSCPLSWSRRRGKGRSELYARRLLGAALPYSGSRFSPFAHLRWTEGVPDARASMRPLSIRRSA